MPRRELSKKNEYWLPAEDYSCAIHYAKRYPLWEAELRTIGALQGVSYDSEAVQTSTQSDSTMAGGIRRAEISAKMDVVRSAVQESAPDIAEWMLLGVTYGLTYYQLADKGMPCGKNYFYERRQKFYWCLARKI